jgi:hypothetical protein
MRCSWPEHHSGGTDTGTGGSWWPLGAAVIAAALLAPVIGVIVHVIALILTFVGIAAVASGGGVLWWRLSHRQPRQLAYQQQPQVGRRRAGRELPQQPQPELAPVQNNLHLHLPEGMHPDQVAAILRRAAGGR